MSLAQIHERLSLALDADERASKITGAPVLGYEGIARLLGHAIAAAGLTDWFETALRLTANDKSAVRPLAAEIDEALDAAMEQFDYRLDLRQPAPPAPPTAEEIAAQAEEDTRQAAAELHGRRIASGDKQYLAAQYPALGSAPSIPGVVPTPTLTAQGGYTPAFLEQEARAHRQRQGGRTVDPHTGRAA